MRRIIRSACGAAGLFCRGCRLASAEFALAVDARRDYDHPMPAISSFFGLVIQNLSVGDLRQIAATSGSVEVADNDAERCRLRQGTGEGPVTSQTLQSRTASGDRLDPH